MSSSTKFLLLAASFLGVQSSAIPAVQRSTFSDYHLETTSLKAFASPAPLVQTDKYTRLERGTGISHSSQVLNKLRRSRNGRKRDLPNLISQQGVEYLTELKFNDDSVKVIVDTGSSDTWLIQSNFKCVNSAGSPVSQKTCNFGTTYPGTFGYSQIPNVNFNISYGDGEFVTGVFGTANIEVAGITVPGQTAALGTYAYWNGDGTSAGLLGLAYSELTSEYKGTDPKRDSPKSRVPYDPFFTTMYEKGLSAASFSLAIERGTGGYLAFGGLPPVAITGDWASTPIQQMTLRSSESLDYAFYTITPDGFSVAGTPSANTDQYIVDSGTTLFYAASEFAASVNAAFSPPATSDGVNYSVDCGATPPDVGVTIGGTTFKINPKDLILQNGDGTCISGIQDGQGGPYILGDVFLTNVVAVFDVGAAEMRFGANENY